MCLAEAFSDVEIRSGYFFVAFLTPKLERRGERLHPPGTVSLIFRDFVSFAVNEAIGGVTDFPVNHDDFAVGEQIDTVLDNIHLQIAGCDLQGQIFIEPVRFDHHRTLKNPHGDVVQLHTVENDARVFAHSKIRARVQQKLDGCSGTGGDDFAGGNTDRGFDVSRSLHVVDESRPGRNQELGRRSLHHQYEQQAGHIALPWAWKVDPIVPDLSLLRAYSSHGAARNTHHRH